MKTPLCDFCLRSGILCSRCEEKVRSGVITKLFMEVAKFLLKLEERYPILQEVFLKDVIEGDDIMALIVDRGDMGKILSYGGKIVRSVSEAFGRRVKVLESGVSDRKFLEDLFAPYRILMINVIWLPDGTTETRVVLDRKSRRIEPKTVEALKKIAKKARDITLRVEFKRGR